jgi:hypothetical protein
VVSAECYGVTLRHHAWPNHCLSTIGYCTACGMHTDQVYNVVAPTPTPDLLCCCVHACELGQEINAQA